MAIQFSCPYCTASVKVPDSASGKLGACPKCGTKIRIPTIPIPPTAAPAQPVAAPSSPPGGVPFVMPMPIDPAQGFPNLLQGAAPTAAPAPPPQAPADPFDFSNIAAAPAAAAMSPEAVVAAEPLSTTRKNKSPRSQPMGKGVLIAIGVALAIMAGVGVWQFIANLPNYEGTAAGERVPSERPIAVAVPWSAIEVPAETQSLVIEYFKRHQTSMANAFLKIDITAGPSGLVIRFETTADSMLVSVDPQLVPDIKTLIGEQKAGWDEARTRELTASAKELCDNLAKAQLTASTMEGVSRYHDSVALNALVRGLGRHVVGVANRTNYPCVFEDEAGKLYFVVPRQTKEIAVVEKSGDKHVRLLPEKFRIWSSIAATALPAPAAVPAEKEAPAETEKPAPEKGMEKMKPDEAMDPEAGEEKMMEKKMM